MKLDTPLAEVAHHLPARTAAVVAGLSSMLQESVLTQVREFVVGIEAGRITLDQIAYEVVLESFVMSTLSVLLDVQQLVFRLQQVHQLSEIQSKVIQ